MKKILTALLLSFIFVLIYTFFSVVVISILAGNPMMNEPSVMQIPLNLPYFVFYNFAPDSWQDIFYSNPLGSVLLKVILFFCNVFLYSVPIYFGIKLISILTKSDNATAE